MSHGTLNSVTVGHLVVCAKNEYGCPATLPKGEGFLVFPPTEFPRAMEAAQQRKDTFVFRRTAIGWAEVIRP